MKKQLKKRWFARVVVISVITLAWCMKTADIQASERALDVAKRYGHNLEERYQPAGSIITEMNTGQILWQENAQIPWAPASMTKVMTILVAYDAMEQGSFTLDTEVPVTDKYLDIGSRYALSNNKMKPGSSYTVSELIDLIIVPSSAAATYMLADLVESNPDKFVELMNKKAVEIGMQQTTYYNSVGVPNYLLEPYHPVNSTPNSNNITSPMDYAILCGYFVKTYPDILNHSKHPQIVVKSGTPYEEIFDTYQISVEGAKYGLEGTDGLKTGSSGDAGFNYASTAKRGDTRLVEIIMGVSTWEDQTGEEIRHLVGNAIMEETFAKYEYRNVLPKGTHDIEGKKVVTEEDFWDCVPKNQEVPFILKDGTIKVNLERQYLPGYQEPKISFREVTKTEQAFNKISSKQDDENDGKESKVKSAIVVAVVGAALIIIVAVIYCIKRKERQRRLRRRKRRR